MKLTTSKKDLLWILGRCQAVADKKGAIPILANVLIDATGDDLLFAATDTVVGARGSIPGKVKERGTFAVNARHLFERVKMMPEGEVSLFVDGPVMTVKSSASPRKYTLHVMPGSEFPILPGVSESAAKLTVSAGTLQRLIASTHFAISTDETRLHLNSALLECDGVTLRMVSTDGHRLARADVAHDGDGNLSLLIPLKAIHELRRICSDADEADEIEIAKDGHNVFFTLGDLVVICKLVDAQFPPWRQVVPDSDERLIEVPRLELADALRAVSVSTDDRTSMAAVTFGKGALGIAAASGDTGEAEDSLPIDYDGPEVKVGINYAYGLDVLGAIESDAVTIGTSGELDPVTIRPSGETAGFDYLAVVMPRRV